MPHPGGSGCAGKASLAFAIVRSWLAGEPGGVVRLPVLIEPALGPQETVAEWLRSWLRNQLASAPEQELAPELVEALPSGLVLVTSRSDHDPFPERPLSRIVPQRIAVQRLQAFFSTICAAGARARPSATTT